jgi:phage terminase Nu1 subunit (DNA packaging protein)
MDLLATDGSPSVTAAEVARRLELIPEQLQREVRRLTSVHTGLSQNDIDALLHDAPAVPHVSRYDIDCLFD